MNRGRSANGLWPVGCFPGRAEALDCELVYVFVPRQLLERSYEMAARAVAHRELAAISHSMALEDQALDDADQDDRLRRFIADELDPRKVWAGRP